MKILEHFLINPKLIEASRNPKYRLKISRPSVSPEGRTFPSGRANHEATRTSTSVRNRLENSVQEAACKKRVGRNDRREAVTNKVGGERIRVPESESDGPPPGPIPRARQ